MAPTEGFDGELDAELAHLLDRAHLSLMRGGAPSEARAKADAIASRESAVEPAQVLAAQADFVADDFPAAVDRLRPIVERNPSYVAAQLVYGRSAEKMRRLPTAAAAYHAVAQSSPLARARLAKIEREAMDQGFEEVRGYLASGEIDAGRAALAALQRWAPRDEETLSVISQLAAVLGDQALELELVRALVAEGKGGRELLLRHADLELAAGDAGRGLKILEEMIREWPEDRALAARLQTAQFDWRLQMLPEAARRLNRSGPLDRGQLAVLVYWVFPSVRYQRANEAIIANDVLDHEHRSEIVRVVNLGLMDIDPNLHAFRPGGEATRVDGLTAMLRVLAKSPKAGRCLEGVELDSRLSSESVCALAADCGLLTEADACLPGSPLTGRDAMELARLASRELEQG